MVYILLLKFVTPSGDRSTWEVYSDLIAAKLALERHKEYTEKMGWMAGINCPRLVQSVLIEAKEIPTT